MIVLTELARELGLTRQALYQRMRAAGITPQKRPWGPGTRLYLTEAQAARVGQERQKPGRKKAAEVTP